MRRAESIDGLKLLVITFLNLLTKQGIELLEENGWKIVEVGERLTTEFYKQLNKLYKLANKIKSAIKNFYVKLSTLPHYINKLTTKQSLLSNVSTTQLANITHDTPVKNKSSIQRIVHPKHEELVMVLLGG